MLTKHFTKYFTKRSYLSTHTDPLSSGATDMFSFTPLIGGALIGLAAALLFASQGRIAGISGIFGGALGGESLGWRAPFLIGLIGSGFIGVAQPDLLGVADPFVNETNRNLGALIAAGFLVGVGTRLGNGCTSGHGVCGLARGSKRSLAATLTFMTTGVIAAVVTQHILTAWVSNS